MKINNMDFKWRVFHAYSDSGHGWLKVPYTACYRLGILRKISSYSYQNGDYIYLEEDCDYTLFMRACEMYGIKPTIKHHSCDGRSFIRNYNHYNPSSIYDKDTFYLAIEAKLIEKYPYLANHNHMCA